MDIWPTDKEYVPTDQAGYLKIEAAKSEYLPQIVSIAKAYQLEQISSERAMEDGFLVSNFAENDYQDFLQRANHFYILLEDKNVQGFVLAYSSDCIQGGEWLHLLIKSRHPDPFIIIKQICIRADRTGRGLATLLYQHLISRAPGLPFFASIVLEPPNHRSIMFHEKFGFKKIFQITPPDGMLRGIWMRSPA